MENLTIRPFKAPDAIVNHVRSFLKSIEDDAIKKRGVDVFNRYYISEITPILSSGDEYSFTYHLMPCNQWQQRWPDEEVEEKL